MDIGDKVEVIDAESCDEEDNVKVGDRGTLVEYHYSIERWWDQGHPLDHKVTVKFRDGRHGKCVDFWSSDLKKTAN